MSPRAVVLTLCMLAAVVSFGLWIRVKRSAARPARVSSAPLPAPRTGTKPVSTPSRLAKPLSVRAHASPTTASLALALPASSPMEDEANLREGQSPRPSTPLIAPSPLRQTPPIGSDSETLALQAPSSPLPTQTPVRYDLRVLVQNEGGRPVSGADVAVVWRQGEPYMRSRGRTDDSGVYQARELTVAQVESLTVEAPGYEVSRLTNVTIPPHTLTVALKRMPMIQGVALSPDGQPFDGSFTATVWAQPRSGPAEAEGAIDLAQHRPLLVASERFARTQGRFEFARVPGGTYAVAVWTDSRLGGVSPWTEIRTGKAAEPLQISLASRLSITGKVLLQSEEPGSTPLPGVEVAAVNWAATLAPPSLPAATRLTGQDGAYALEGLPGGIYQVTASPGVPSIEPGARSDVLLTPAAPCRVDFALVYKPIRLAGQVLGESGEPLPDAAVLLLRAAPEASQRQTKTDPSGQFQFDGLSEGVYHLGVTHPHEPARQKMFRILLTGSGPASFDVRFYPRKHVVGRVYRNGLPARGGTIRFVCKADQENHPLAGGVGQTEVAIDPETGTYEALLEPGQYEIPTGEGPGQTLVAPSGPEPVFQVDLYLP